MGYYSPYPKVLVNIGLPLQLQIFLIANGLFLSCGNIGVTIGTGVGGLIIAGMGTQYIVLEGLLFLLLGLASIILGRYMLSARIEQVAS